MGTNIRSEVSRDNPYWIPKQRYYELKHFCMQYHDWKERLSEIDSMKTASIQMVIHNGEFSDAVYRAAEFRERYLLWIDCVDAAAKRTVRNLGSDIRDYVAELLITGISKGIPYDTLQVWHDCMPISKDAYYDLYRRFFFELDKIRG